MFKGSRAPIFTQGWAIALENNYSGLCGQVLVQAHDLDARVLSKGIGHSRYYAI